MLISFTVENWRSFKKSATLSMAAGREQQHGSRLMKLNKYRMRVLPTTAVYGGNASGKSNFISAMAFAQRCILEVVQPESRITVEPFLLDQTCKNKPSKFIFNILIDKDIYEYSFSVTSAMVKEERLQKITSKSEITLFHRFADDDNPHFHQNLRNNPRLRFAFEGTRANQLFLSNSVYQKLNDFEDIYNWFKDVLVFIFPDTAVRQIGIFIDEDSPYTDIFNTMLDHLDTGIKELTSEDIAFENLPISDDLKRQILSDLKESHGMDIGMGDGEKIILRLKDDMLQVKRLCTSHMDSHGEPIRFQMRQESDGTKRIIEFLPLFFQLCALKSEKIYIIDEIDRSLHYLLIRKLLESFLNVCGNETRKQLIFTTHDVMLMDQNILRRDEIWITERSGDGSSELISFAEFKDVRRDKDIRGSYLEGRMGGIPNLIDDLLQNLGETEDLSP